MRRKVVLFFSVANPDPDPVFSGHTDPVGSGLFRSPGSGSGKIPDPGLVIKKNCLIYSFVKIFFFFDFKCHNMFIFGIKMPYNFFLLNIKNISK